MLFLFILYTSLGIVSVYLTNSQTAILKEKSVAEYHSIAATLAKDISVLYGRSGGFTHGMESISTLVNGYRQYYLKQGIEIIVTESNNYVESKISFVQKDEKHFIFITGMLPESLWYYQLDYYFDITENIINMQNIQNTLLAFAALFSVLTAILLYFILANIFKPLHIIAETSRKIADGHYEERVDIKDKHELLKVAINFNRMADEIHGHL
jgi:HAMP domain-containing protein